MRFEVYRTRQRQDEPERHCIAYTFPKVQGPACNPDSGKLVSVAVFSTPYKLGTFVPPCQCQCRCTCHLMHVPESKGVSDGLFY